LSDRHVLRASLEEEEHGLARPAAAAETGLALPAFDREFHGVVCPGCSCLCDDISLYLMQGGVVSTLNLCETGLRRLGSAFTDSRLPAGTLSQQAPQAAALLRAHPPVLVLGADVLDDSAVRASLEIASALGGLWLPWAWQAVRRFHERVNTYGWASALLDEVRDRADTVLFWRTDPLETHHRHLSRYSFFACGRTTERGHHDRNLAAVAQETPHIEPLCRQFFRIPPDQDPALIQALLRPGVGEPFPHRDADALARALKRSSFTAIFLDPARLTDPALDLLFQWSAEVNAGGRTRMVLLPLWDGGANTEGFCKVSLERNAAAWGADFSGRAEGGPPPSWEVVAEAAGSVLLVECGPERTNSRKLPPALAARPCVTLDPFKTPGNAAAGVTIPTALPGVECGGLFFRADGLPLRASAPGPLRAGPYPSPTQVLEAILQGLTGSRP